MQQVFVAGANWLQDLQIFLAAVFGYIKEWQFLIASLLHLIVWRHIYKGYRPTN